MAAIVYPARVFQESLQEGPKEARTKDADRYILVADHGGDITDEAAPKPESFEYYTSLYYY